MSKNEEPFKGSSISNQENNEGNFYVFEALDGVGKTTTAQMFAESIGAKYLETHDPAYEEFKSRVKREDASLETKLLFYLGSNSLRGDRVIQELERGNDVVMDRYYHSTLAFHYAKSGEDPIDMIETVDNFDIVEPDEAFYLWVDEEERLNRIEERKETGHEFEKDSEFMAEVDQAYREMADELDMPLLEAKGGVERVTDQAIELIKETNNEKLSNCEKK